MRMRSSVELEAEPSAAPRRKIKLVHVLTIPGSLIFLRGQSAFFRARGYEVHAITSPGPELDAFAREECVSVAAVEMPRRITPLQDLVALARLWRELRRIAPDIVQAATPKGGLLGMMAAFLARTPARIYHIRGLPFVTATGARRRLLVTTEWISCRLAHRVLAVSHSMRELAIAEGICPPGKIEVLLGGSGNGVDAAHRFRPQPERVRLAERERLGIPADAVVIGFVGRPVREKGLFELAAAWRALRERHPGLHLVIAGGDDEGAVPSDVWEELQADARVHVAGFVEDMPTLYSACDVVALPTYREGFPEVALETAAMALPIVATSVPGCVDAVKGDVTGLLVPPRDPGALADALERLIAEPPLRAALGRAARERVLAEFDQGEMWKAFAAVYDALLR